MSRSLQEILKDMKDIVDSVKTNKREFYTASQERYAKKVLEENDEPDDVEVSENAIRE